MNAGLPDWRDPIPYDLLSRADRAGIMWEWLRRDRAYRIWHHGLAVAASVAANGVIRLEETAGAAAWGLHFR